MIQIGRQEMQWKGISDRAERTRRSTERDKSPTIKGVNGPDDWGYRKAIDSIVSRRLPLDALSTHHFSFTETESAIRTLAGEAGGEPALGITVTA
jgi:hypothetical protein